MESPPTQELPPWYTLITSTATDATGHPTATFTTLMRLPLTYYGPSIPLGTDTNIWVYGGPTPPSTANLPPVSPTPPSSMNVTPTPPSTPATPPSSTLPPTSTTITSLSSPVTSSLSVTSTVPTASGSSTHSSITSSSTSAGPTSAPGSSRLDRTAIGAIVGSIIAALIILLCCLLVLRWRRSTRRYRDGHDLLTPAPERHRHSRLYSFTDDSPRNQPVESKGPREPIWTGWSMVHTSAENRSVPPVEGGWTLVHDNDSGDRVPGEGSPRGSGEETDPFLRASHSNQMSQHPSARLVTPAPVLDATHNSMDSTSTGASGYGIVVEPSQARFSHLVPPPTTQWGNIIPPAVLTQMVDEPRRHDDIMEEDEEESLLQPPPRLDPDRLGTSRTTPRPSLKSLRTSQSERSLPVPDTPASWDETPQLMTAQRIRVDEMDRAEAREVPSPITGSPSLLGRLGWLSRRSRQSTPERQESRPTTPHLEPDVEAGPSSRLLGHPQGLRPISGHSGTSGESESTLFHDAQSRTETPPPLPSPPPALTISSRSRLPISEPMQESTSEAPTIRVVGSSSPSQLQTDDVDPFADPTSSTAVHDPLDAPAPVSRFATTPHERDPMFPPGLIISRSWMTSSGTLGDSNHTDSPVISMDIYEEAPPSVAERWRFMTGGSGSGRSTQPPILVHPRDVFRSEAGSLHSMMSHLGPGSPRSVSGSAPTSLFQRTPDSSQGSKSHGRSQGSGHSLVHQTSISSQGRRRRRRPEIGESPLPSPYGRLSLGATGTTAMRFDFGQHDGGPSMPVTPFSAYFTADGSINSAGTNITADVVDPVTGVAVRMPRMPAYTHDRENRYSYPYYPLGD
ncbi:hypothetical protein BDM02DRAFT_3260668 [Thelephora ganbajun]|uniref:Uncharacterized protein n=1 Tax=Thelephora ganbajun TaxID=370292 RepID=A0ACB6ZH60_THEGA|nr:hypothetical protein BDM02DRAFT_3260668 [Thelephora ganbajun]